MITRKNTILSFLTMLLMSSCSWLDVAPSNEVNEDDLDLRNALNGIYLKLGATALYGSNLSYGFIEVLGHQYLPEYMETTSTYYKASEFKYDDADVKSVISNLWSNGYNGIASCNHLIQMVSEAGPTDFQELEMEKNLIHGEALALRALFHFDILRTFAPSMEADDGKAYMPYVDLYPVISTTYYPNVEILKKIENDLIKARDLVAMCDVKEHPEWMETQCRMFAKGINSELPKDVFFAYRGYRMNYYAITALLARVYMWEKEYKKAYDMAMEVIEAKIDGSKFFGLVEHTSLKEDMKDSESILFTLSRVTLEEEYRPYTDTNSKTRFWFNKTDIFEDSQEDKRASSAMVEAAGDVYYSKKYLIAEGTNDYDMIPILRLSEMYYIIAEYAARTNDFTTAANALETVCSARGMISKTFNFVSLENFLDELVKEVRKELIGEGQLYFLYKRLDRKSFADDVKFVFDRPENEDI